MRDCLRLPEVPCGAGGHAGYKDCLPWIEDQLCFTVVRHPLNWLPSLYAHMKGPDGKRWDALPGPMEVFEWCSRDSFTEFVRDVVRNPGMIARAFGRYTDCGRVLRTESLAEDLVEVLREGGEEFDPAKVLAHEHKNVTKRPKPEWTPDLKEAILESESDFIACYWSPSSQRTALGTPTLGASSRKGLS